MVHAKPPKPSKPLDEVTVRYNGSQSVSKTAAVGTHPDINKPTGETIVIGLLGGGKISMVPWADWVLFITTRAFFKLKRDGRISHNGPDDPTQPDVIPSGFTVPAAKKQTSDAPVTPTPGGDSVIPGLEQPNAIDAAKLKKWVNSADDNKIDLNDIVAIAGMGPMGDPEWAEKFGTAIHGMSKKTIAQIPDALSDAGVEWFTDLEQAKTVIQTKVPGFNDNLWEQALADITVVPREVTETPAENVDPDTIDPETIDPDTIDAV